MMSSFRIKLFIIFFCIVFHSCGGNNDYNKYILSSDCTVENAIDSAKQHNKLLFVAFGDSKDCGHTTNFLKRLSSDGVLEKYKDDYIFCVASIAEDSPNAFYKHILIPPTIPNSYIFNQEGKLISLTHPGMIESQFIDYQLQYAKIGNPINPNEHSDYSVGGNRLLKLLNTLIDITRKYHSSENDTTKLKPILDEIHENINIEECFYNRYLQSKIYNDLHNTELADSAATKAITILKSENQDVIYSNLYSEIVKLSSYYYSISKKAGKLVFENKAINCGTIRQNEKKQFRLSFENKGEKAIVITQASTSCNCIEIDFSKAPIQPKQKGEILFTYHGNSKGNFTKTVSFRNNGAEIIVPVILRGVVE